jgi:hypothetical protein
LWGGFHSRRVVWVDDKHGHGDDVDEHDLDERDVDDGFDRDGDDVLRARL